MKQCYLFVHFKEKRTPDGEQIYFALSQDGYHWEAVNNGQPVLWSVLGERGVRDFTILRDHNGRFYILATDLCLAYELRGKYANDWGNIVAHGRNCLMMWESEDLCHWSEQRMLPIRKPDTGCCWAPDIIEDPKTGEYIVHWSSPNFEKNGKMSIYYTRTSDFKHFSDAQILYEKSDETGCIDSCMVEEKGTFYLFVKSFENPVGVILLKSSSPVGPWERMPQFDPEIQALTGGPGVYEAPTACRLADGSYTLMLDYFGVQGKGQGYVPFHCEHIEDGVFKRDDAEFSYPYGFKHGTILTISEEEYERVRSFDYEAESYNR